MTLPVAVLLLVGLLALRVDAGPDAGRDSGHEGKTAPDAAAAVGAAGQNPAPAPHTDRGDHRPNIVLVSADDMRADEMRYLPRTRRLLGATGLTYREALTPHPLCCPARAEIMTGQYAQNNGVRTNFGPQGGYPAFDPTHTIGGWLNEAGYNTAFVGKHLNSVKFPHGRDPGWTLFDPSLTGYSDYRNFGQFNDGEPTRVIGRYYTDYLGQQSAAYAHELALYRSPFFLWVSHFGPHSTEVRRAGVNRQVAPRRSPSYLADRHAVRRDAALARARVRELRAAPAYDERDVSDKQRLLSRAGEVNPVKVRRLVKGRIGALRSLDSAVAHLLRQLEQDHVLENTFVVFVTDNGFLLGEHRWVGKTLGYEEALRTPMLVRGPGVAPGAVTDRIGTLVDLAPTFLDIAGARADVPQDGRSMLDVWHGRRPGRPDPHQGGVLIQAGPLRSQTGPRGWYFRGVRTERYTYMRFFDGFVELYDRARDPHQVSSVAEDPAYRAVRAELARRTRILAECSGPGDCNRRFGGPVPEPSGPGSRGG